MPARIEILQWREAFDDEDSLSVGVFADGDDTDLAREECEAHELAWTEGHPDVESGRIAPEDVDHAFLQIQSITILDGEIIEHNGRSFQINIVEVQRAAV